MSRFELIIFDCDGVLVDSERLANEIFAKILNDEFGLSLSLNDMFETFVGHSSSQCMAIIEKMLGHAPPADLEHYYKDEINRALASSVIAVSGIRKTLHELSTPFCVASSGSHEKMKITLGKTQLLSFFEGRRFSTSEVARGKPYPDVYLYAAAKMGVSETSKCLVIEDSPLGVRGGVAANMTVFGYSELTGEQKLLDAGAHHTFECMDNLVNEISEFEQAKITVPSQGQSVKPNL